MDGSLPSLAGVTCSHLYHAIPMMASGWFWIDPNGGDNADAVSVYCEVQTDNANTLVYALQNLAQDRHTGPSGTDQLSFISSYISGEFEYNISASQLQALQDQSSVGRQSLVFQCKGVLVHSWTSQSNTNDLVENFTFWKSSRGLLWYADGSNATALGSNYSDVQRYPVYYLDDGCKSNNIDIWSNTTVLFASNEPAAVPIVDVALLDAYSIKEEFGIDFGPAVFSTTSFKDLGLSQFKPGRSCLDILGTGNSRGDGVYWIDPLRNGDTVLVRCNMTAGGFTQIPREPTQKVPLSQWVTEGQDAYRWFSDTPSGYKLAYTMSLEQVQALIAMSTVGYQYLSYQCRSVVTWYSNDSPHTDLFTNPLQLKAVGGQLWNKAQSANFFPEVVNDSCYFNDVVVHNGSMILHGPASGFPIVDFALHDWSDTGEEFGLTLEDAWVQ
eukprot:m.17335 g.17335  ORF g.17335 m.17335 type:complete len:440 (-) comp10665_c0_seq2:179-1498(-)